MPRLLCGAGGVIDDVLSNCQEVDCNHSEPHGLMYNDKLSDFSEQLCSPQDYPVFIGSEKFLSGIISFSSYSWLSSVHASLLFSSKTLKIK